MKLFHLLKKTYKLITYGLAVSLGLVMGINAVEDNSHVENIDLSHLINVQKVHADAGSDDDGGSDSASDASAGNGDAT